MPAVSRHTRAKRARAQQHALEALAAWNAPLFPAPTNAKDLSWDEWHLYHARLDAFLAKPTTPKLWELPTPDVVTKAWAVLPELPSWETFYGNLFPPLADLNPEETGPLAERVKAAVVVTLEAILAASYQSKTGGRFLVIDFVDALARAWSPCYWITRADAETPVPSLHGMATDTIKAVRRDLLCRGIPVEALWKFFTQPTPTYRPLLPYRVARRDDGAYHVSRKFLTKEQEERLASLTALYSVKERSRRLVVAPPGSSPLLDVLDVPDEEFTSKYRVCGGRIHQASAIGPRGHALLRIQEQSTLLLDVQAFLRRMQKARKSCRGIEAALVRDYPIPRPDTGDDTMERLCSSYQITPKGKPQNADGSIPGKRKPRHGSSVRQRALNELCSKGVITRAQREHIEGLLTRWDKPHWIVSQFEQVEQELLQCDLKALAPDGYLPIRSGYERTINGRWQAAHFSPLAVSTKEKFLKAYQIGSTGEGREFDDSFYAGLRAEWFKAPPTHGPLGKGSVGRVQDLVSIDVESSQIQIIALLTGSKELYDAACSPGGTKFKFLLAELAWEHVPQWSPTAPHGYRKAEKTDPKSRLVAMVKATVMRYVYGSTLETIRDDHREDREKRDEFGAGFLSIEHAEAFLHSIPGWKDLETFLQVARMAALNAWHTDRYAGFLFRDVFDGITQRWNPIETVEAKVKFGADLPLTTIQPRGPAAEEGPWAGDHPVDLQRLLQFTPPCLIHFLDAAFSGAMVEALWRRGILTFSAVHDCWAIAEWVLDGLRVRSGFDVLEECKTEAMQDWFPRLGLLYDDLLQILSRRPPVTTPTALKKWAVDRALGKPAGLVPVMNPRDKDYREAWQAVLGWKETWQARLQQAQETQGWPGVRTSRSEPRRAAGTGRIEATPRRSR